MKLSLLLTAAFLSAAAALPQSKPATGTIDALKVHGPSLENNLEGDTPDRDVFVYLPPSYAANRTKRYPVVYLLHGYGRVAKEWVPFIGLPASLDNGLANNLTKGTTKEMIVVVPDANTKYGGSMYSNSPTTGNWEAFITNDLVTYIDTHYRTLATRDSRGLGGHSMGGYGVWRIAMKYPEVYSSVYAMSACCLMNNPQPRPANAAPPRAPENQSTSNVDVASGQAAAWSPNPLNPPLYFDRPLVDNQVQLAIAAKWIANSPLAMLDQYASNLKKYNAVGMDIGLQDTLLNSNKEMDQSLTRLQVPHEFQTYEGDHTNHVRDRIELRVLPFFSEHLSFTPSKKTAKGK